MSDNCSLEKYHWGLDFRDDETVEENETSLDVQYLQHLLGRRDHKRFLVAFEGITTHQKDFLQALGGEGLCLLLDDADIPRNDWSISSLRQLQISWQLTPSSILMESSSRPHKRPWQTSKSQGAT